MSDRLDEAWASESQSPNRAEAEAGSGTGPGDTQRARDVAGEGYHPRLIDEKIATALGSAAVVEIVGPAGCGKRITALRHAASEVPLATGADARSLAQADPTLIFVGAEPRAVTDAHLVSALGPAAENYGLAVAAAGAKGSLILTSSRAGDSRGVAKGSEGAPGSTQLTAGGTRADAEGIARITMGPMTLQELRVSDASVSLEGLLEGEIRPTAHRLESWAQIARVTSGESECGGSVRGEDRPVENPLGTIMPGALSTPEVARLVCRGGWPSALSLSDVAAGEYAAAYVRRQTEAACAGTRLDPKTAHALAWSLAAHVSEMPPVSELASGVEAATGTRPARDTIRAYLDLLRQVQLVAGVPGWVPPGRDQAHVRIKPVCYFADPALPAALLAQTPTALLTRPQVLTALLCNLVYRDLSVYLGLQSAEIKLYHYAEGKGPEATFIVEQPEPYCWGAIQVCLSDAGADLAARDLLRLKKRVKACAPSFLAIVTGRGGYPVQREDGIYVIPIANLGA